MRTVASLLCVGIGIIASSLLPKASSLPIRPSSAVFHPEQPLKAWAVDRGRLYQTTDGGQTWIRSGLESGLLAKSVWVSRATQDVVFVSVEQGGLYRSTDEGQSWLESSNGLPPSIGHNSKTVVTDLEGAQGTSIIYCATEVEGVFRSDDQGATWRPVSHGLPVPLLFRTRPPLVAVDPIDPSRVFTHILVPVHSEEYRNVLFGSTDGGGSWAVLKVFPEEELVEAIDVNQPGRIHVKSNVRAFDVTDTTDDVPRDARTGVTRFRNPEASPLDQPARLQQDINDISVMEDDGTLLFRPFDLEGQSLEFRPNGSRGYTVKSGPVNLDPDIGDWWTFGDDDSRRFNVGFLFEFYGVPHGAVWVNSNGSVTFEGPDRSLFPSETAFAAGRPKASIMWADFEPDRIGAGIYLRATADRFQVTWKDVPLFRSVGTTTMQLTLFRDGLIQFHYESMATRVGLVGISPGSGTTFQTLSLADTRDGVDLRAIPSLQFFDEPEVDIVSAAQKFYASHGDDFDSLIFFGAGSFDSNLAGPGAVAYYAPVRNDVRGIGLSVQDSTRFFGSRGRLQGVINMNSLKTYPDDPKKRFRSNNNSLMTVLGQEWGHRFLSFVRYREPIGTTSSFLLGRQLAHWSYFFNSEGSLVEGNEWVDEGGGSFRSVANTYRFSRLDQYLMGLRSANEVEPTFLILGAQPLVQGSIRGFGSTFGLSNNAIRDNTKHFGAPGRYEGFVVALGSSFSGGFITHSGVTENGPDPTTISVGFSIPSFFPFLRVGDSYLITKFTSSAPQSFYVDEDGNDTTESIVFTGVRRDVEISQILDYEGDRTPRRGIAPTQFRHAFILLVPRGERPSETDLAKMGRIRSEWETFYTNATDGLSRVSTSLR